MTLLTAKILAKKLRALGATVLFVRSAPEPATNVRPGDLLDAARTELKVRQQLRFIRDKYDGPADQLGKIRAMGERTLVLQERRNPRARENRERRFAPRPHPLHALQRRAWGDETKPKLTDKNHFHLIINGSYEPGELALDDVRFEMLFKLLTRSYPEELAISKQVAATFSQETGLPAYTYPQPSPAEHPVPASRICGCATCWPTVSTGTRPSTSSRM